MIWAQCEIVCIQYALDECEIRGVQNLENIVLGITRTLIFEARFLGAPCDPARCAWARARAAKRMVLCVDQRVMGANEKNYNLKK